jgi:hypothetical protein
LIHSEDAEQVHAERVLGAPCAVTGARRARGPENSLLLRAFAVHLNFFRSPVFSGAEN